MEKGEIHEKMYTRPKQEHKNWSKHFYLFFKYR